MASPRRGRRSRRPRTPLNNVMLWLFALMLLSPIAAQASVADQADAQREAMAQATEVPDNGVEEPIAEPTDVPFVEPTEEPFVEPTEEPVVEPTEAPFVEPTEEPEGEQLGAIEIEYRECEEDYAFLDGTNEDDLDQMLMACAQADGVEFTIDQSGPEGDTQLTGEFGDSHVSFTEVPTGLRTVAQSIPFDDTYVVCNGIVQNGGPETGVMEVPVTNGAFEWDLLDEEVAFCNWFVAGAPGLLSATEMPTGEQVGAFEIEYRECEEDYAFLDGTDEDLLDQMLMECSSLDGVEFTVDQGGPDGGTQLTGEFGDSHVSFTEVPTGPRTVTQTTAPANLVIYCEGIVSNGGPETGVMPMTATNGAIEWDLLDDEIVYCNWFAGAGAGNTITVYKWDCPSGTVYSQELEYYGTECATEHLNIPITLVDANGEHPTTTQANGTQWNNVAIGQAGELQIFEEIPEGYGDPVVYCWSNDGDPALVESTGGFVTPRPDTQDGRFDYYCNWYNVPGAGSAVTITKWYCPEGVPYDEEQAYYEQNCTQYHEGVDFKLTHAEGSTFDTTDANGQAEWTAVPLGPFSIQEYIPQEYGEPIVFCGFTAMDDGAIADGFPVRADVLNGYYEADLELPNTSYFCQWYNVPGEPGEITIYKYTCPEGYDLYAWGANPMDDCREGTNDVTFNLSGEGYDSQFDTGDSVDYAVFFGGLEPGAYTAVENVPSDTWYVFVLDCYGQKIGKLRPYPLSMGDTLEIELGAGESIECYWYNVPEYDEGRLTVYKYQCSTETYTSDVDCEIYEDGKTFDLVMWNGDEWEYADSGITDGGGMATWGGIDPGEYWLDEQDGDWCHMKSEQLSGDGNWINVYDGQETIVTVYNCSSDPGDKGKPGKTPTKYPNTGIGPEQGPGGPAELPAFAPLAGLLALLATHRTRRTTIHIVGEDVVSSRATRRSNGGERAATQGGPYETHTPEGRMFHTLSRRKLAALLTVPLGGTALVRSGLLAQGDQVIEPTDGTPPGGTPTSLCLPATPGAESEDEDDCLRGPVPFTLQIAAIEVDAPVEILETVGGVMQQPSDEAHVAWYKETARLGELGNILIAGHLNWWGHPEAVFFDLGTLREGDEVVLLDEEENAFTYEVEWVRQENNLEPPAEEVLGMTAYEAVTLMTCGGQWDSSISEYDERTVARAMRVADEGTPEAI